MIDLISFIVVSIILAVVPVFVGCRLLKVDNPSGFMILLGVIGALALKDMAFTYIEEPQSAWPAAAIMGGFIFSLLLDTAYWRGLLIAILILGIEHIAVAELLDGTSVADELGARVTAAQVELWPDYHD